MNQADERFKFRIWDERRKRYMGHSPCVELIEETISQFYLDEDSKVIEQCTGFRDKIGVLIFEGDIIFFKNNCYEVIWHHGTSSFCLYSKNLTEIQPLLACELKRMQVVNNIHEVAE